ncbi:MAG: NifB/NifX family molybdenum-iron cluster-binding protein [Bacteroidota bacterium]
MNSQHNIAVAVNKNDKIWPGHFGISPHYNIYDRDKNLIEKRLNPHGAGNSSHGHDHDDDQPKFIKEVLHDCNVFIGKRMGDKSKLMLAEKLGITTILTKQPDPEKALEEYLK